MKKRLVAVMLGLTLSLATVGEAGAAAFSSPDSEMVQAEMTETENTDVFSAGDGDEQDAQTDDADHIQDVYKRQVYGGYSSDAFPAFGNYSGNQTDPGRG